MKIVLTLSEVLHRTHDWEKFCEEKGWSEWAVNEGGGDIEVSLTEEEAIKYGVLRPFGNLDRG
ncbi:hypothetical protein LCGC14_1233970 [marine sediment metagenome]|uniref:Uncharacterized protein n=1 Tax=marine sediment metagenome TaxID=412755 RepID=A0A0F9L7R6_9ZZZZ